MSLFKVREWWRVKCGSGEEFDQGSLCVANIDNSANGREKIITGSLHGVLRIYQPSERDFKIEDQLLEIDLKQAILQLEVGRFSAAGGIQLAVLHPRSLSVYSVEAGSPNPNGASFMEINKLYHHHLEHTAANMVHGSFGGISGADFICVQSYDGQLSFFEQESEAFSRYLPNFLVPGPLCYCQSIDSFITCNSAFELECYKYQVLAAAAGGKNTDGVKGMSHRKQLQVDWMLVLGEGALSISVGRISKHLSEDFQADIIVLGEHTLFCISEKGEIRAQHLLEYHPSAFLSYPVRDPSTPGGHENLIVGTHTAALLVYHDGQLLWAAKGETVPVCIRTAEFGGVNGMIVTLDDEGVVSVNYLGTDPPTNVVAITEGKELDYEEMDAEHRRLLRLIRENASERREEPKHQLHMRMEVPSTLSATRSIDEPGVRTRLERCVAVTVYLHYTGPGTLEEVSISVKPPYPITVNEDSLIIPQLEGGDGDAVVELSFCASTECLPTGCTASIFASYTSPQGEPHVSVQEIPLPLPLFCQLVPPVKNAAYKLTLDTNRPPPHLFTVFEDMVAQSQNVELINRVSNGNALTFQYYNGMDATIVVSRSGGRYRLQSDTFEAMWLVTEELARRLNQYYGKEEGEEAFRISCEDAVPVDVFSSLIDSHFAHRVHLAELRKELEKRAHQFRSVQKRLLVRFKDRTPAPLNHLDALVVNTYHQLMELADDAKKKQQQLKQAGVSLACGVRLLQHWIRFTFQLSDDTFEVLKGALSAEVAEESEIGWEEHTEASLTNLLRTVLAKSAKEAAAVPQAMSMADDTRKLKKHLAIMLDRLAKGQGLVKIDVKERSSE